MIPYAGASSTGKNQWERQDRENPTKTDTAPNFREEISREHRIPNSVEHTPDKDTKQLCPLGRDGGDRGNSNTLSQKQEAK